MLNDLGLKMEVLESFMAGEINVSPYTLEPLPIGDGEALPGALHLRVVWSCPTQVERHGRLSGAYAGRHYASWRTSPSTCLRLRHTHDASG